jgi:hypothetical protein
VHGIAWRRIEAKDGNSPNTDWGVVRRWDRNHDYQGWFTARWDTKKAAIREILSNRPKNIEYHIVNNGLWLRSSYIEFVELSPNGKIWWAKSFLIEDDPIDQYDCPSSWLVNYHPQNDEAFTWLKNARRYKCKDKSDPVGMKVKIEDRMYTILSLDPERPTKYLAVDASGNTRTFCKNRLKRLEYSW